MVALGEPQPDRMRVDGCACVRIAAPVCVEVGRKTTICQWQRALGAGFPEQTRASAQECRYLAVRARSSWHDSRFDQALVPGQTAEWTHVIALSRPGRYVPGCA